MWYFSEPCRGEEKYEQWAKCPLVLYAKPSNKRFIISLQKIVILQLASIFLVRVFRNILIPSVRMMLTMRKIFARIICQTIEWEVSYFTGSRGYVFVVRTSKPVENLWKKGLFWSRYSFVTHSIYRKDWGLARSAYRIKSFFHSALLATVALRAGVRQRGYGLRLLIFKMVNDKVDLGQIRSEEIVYSRFIKIPLG